MRKADNYSQSGFTLTVGLLILVVIALIGFTGYYVWHSQKQTNEVLNATNKSGQSTVTVAPKAKKGVTTGASQSAAKAAADSPMPAAGSCATSSTAVVAVTLNLDVPSPRCVQVTSSQSLRLTNATASTVTATLGGKSVTIAVGASGTITTPFGDYLQTGDHVVKTGLYGGSGPEVYLPAN